MTNVRAAPALSPGKDQAPMAIQRNDEIDYGKSTMAFPMQSEPAAVFTQVDEVDYSKSTNAFPMYDDAEKAAAAATGKGVTVSADTTAGSTGEFPTPGPSSVGRDDLVTTQRAGLALSDDPSGDSDAGYQARPSTIAVPGADGIDRDNPTAPGGAEARPSGDPADDAPTLDEETPVPDSTPATKTVKTAQTKVVKPPAPAGGAAKTTGTTK